MSEFFSITPMKQEVTIRTGDGPKTFSVIGIPFKIFLGLVSRFPDLGKIIEGGTIDVPQVMTYGGDAVASLIAAGWGKPGDEEHEAFAATLQPEQSVDFLYGILKATMPDGIGPFKEKIDKISAIVSVKREPSVAPSAEPQPSASPEPEREHAAGNMKWRKGPDGEIVLEAPRQRASATPSPKQSSGSSPEEDTTKIRSGT